MVSECEAPFSELPSAFTLLSGLGVLDARCEFRAMAASSSAAAAIEQDLLHIVRTLAVSPASADDTSSLLSPAPFTTLLMLFLGLHSQDEGSGFAAAKAVWRKCRFSHIHSFLYHTTDARRTEDNYQIAFATLFGAC
jgi:hypothetical protein